MRTEHASRVWRAVAILVLTISWHQPAVAESPDKPAINTLRGIVISKADGTPVADVQVVMAHNTEGHVDVGWHGYLGGCGHDEKNSRALARRNVKTFCDTCTDSEGRFTLRSFALPDEPWNLAAGGREHGFVLLTNVVPAEHTDDVLRVELDKPAGITVTPPPDPTDKDLRASVGIALAPSRSPEPTQPVGGQPIEPSPRAAHETPEFNVDFYSSGRPRNEEGRETKEPWHLGSFPPGFKYRITSYVHGTRLSYRPTIFERTVSLTPGASETLMLESRVGARVSGHVTDTKDRPLADVNVLMKVGAGSGLVIGALTDQKGHYELSGVPSGSHKLELVRYAVRAAPG